VYAPEVELFAKYRRHVGLLDDNDKKIEKITIFGGCGKDGKKEEVEKIEMKMGDVISIVGPTGGGKTALIDDIAMFANGNTPTKRRVLINDEVPAEDMMLDPSRNPIALITQHTNFLSDMPVQKFLETHTSIRQSGDKESVVKETIEFANQLTGEPIILDNAMTELSGGQTRSLLIADAVIIGNSPIILLDEIENAGINRTKALELLKNYKKIFIFVTHDPRIALLSDFRIVMKNGAMQKVLKTDSDEKKVMEEIKKLDDLLQTMRNKLRLGERLTTNELEQRLKAMGYL
jgi:ABC-type lipoprotein export system ATPase subunit